MMPISRTPIILVALLALGAASAARGQESAWRSFVSVSPVFEEGNLSGGGSFRVAGAILRAGTSTGFGDGHRIGLTLNYDYSNYSFTNPSGFNGVAPWNIVQRYGFTVPLSFALRDGWTAGIAPSLDWFRENGAKASDALAWGATFSGVKRFADDKLLGLGIGAFDRVDKFALFPFPIVDWRLGPRWRLINPLAAGPTGPAGLELDYLFDNGWTLGAGVAWRQVRFRLSENGPVANGIGEITGAPVFLRASRSFDRTVTLNLYAGVVVADRFRVEDSSGNRVRDVTFNISPIVGANLTARF